MFKGKKWRTFCCPILRVQEYLQAGSPDEITKRFKSPIEDCSRKYHEIKSDMDEVRTGAEPTTKRRHRKKGDIVSFFVVDKKSALVMKKIYKCLHFHFLI